jgi:hypothetical protein
MSDQVGTYDTAAAKAATLEKVTGILSGLGAKKIYIKKLAPNDNSKNQPYFGAHLTDLPFIPAKDIQASTSRSKKLEGSGRKIKYQVFFDLIWVDIEGNIYSAPNAKLIYYPQYPEVRFSGYLKGAKVNASRWMDPAKDGRSQGRWLILGVSKDEKVYSYLVTPESALSNELDDTDFIEISSVFSEVDIRHQGVPTDTKSALVDKLLEIHQMGWITGRKMGKDMVPLPYKAQNGGGYTLEAMLGISPNGIAEPDYLGWEVKQFGVKDFPRKQAKPTTLMTPEPNGGFYDDYGAGEFVRLFGYADKSGKQDRMNFGGRHFVGNNCNTTGLTMHLEGFDADSSRIIDANGAITLSDTSGTVAASWSFAKIMNHWKKKHSQAVYVPCKMRKAESGGREYYYGSNIELGIGTNFEIFLSAMAKGYVYYDPGIKLEKASCATSVPKKRSQFRVNHKHLYSLYHDLEFLDLNGTNL